MASTKYAKKFAAEKIIQVVTDDETKAALKQIAVEDGRTLSNLASKILKDFVAAQTTLRVQKSLLV